MRRDLDGFVMVASVLLLGAAVVSGQVTQVSFTPVAWASLLFQGHRLVREIPRLA